MDIRTKKGQNPLVQTTFEKSESDFTYSIVMIVRRWLCKAIHMQQLPISKFTVSVEYLIAL